MDVMRRSFEEKIYQLTQRMQSNSARWKEVNHLVVDGNSHSPVGYDKTSSAPNINPYHFLEELGIDVASLRMVPNQVFVLTPFHEIYESTYLTIKSACALNQLVAVRGDEAFQAGNILKYIIEQIIVSPYIIANINGRNPNVHYELGIAHSLGKNIVLVSETLEDIAFDLQGERILTYRNREELNVKLYVYYTKLLSGRGKSKTRTKDVTADVR